MADMTFVLVTEQDKCQNESSLECTVLPAPELLKEGGSYLALALVR